MGENREDSLVEIYNTEPDVRMGGSGERLVAELPAEPWCPERYAPGAEVKAATAHGLALRPVDGGWEARATLDV